jgi:hypothetical protein
VDNFIGAATFPIVAPRALAKLPGRLGCKGSLGLAPRFHSAKTRTANSVLALPADDGTTGAESHMISRYGRSSVKYI